ncbi:MAG: Gfo/Idh/MocA family oxidoreductase [Chloroflexi bacterium]|nr:Gfo/Idh/MocA family oxidoreductase [Chloroflexota bacterium]
MGENKRVVLVGCRGMSDAWLKAAGELPDLTVVGLVDIRREAAERRAAEFGLSEALISTSLTEALDKTRPDGVFDCTIPEAHVAVTLEALAHGCHVFGEKPMADSMEHARQMVSAAQQARKIYAVIQNRRYDARIRRLRNFIASGAIGRITTVNCDFYLGPRFGGFRDEMAHPLVLDMAIHTFDAARYITGADPVGVLCREWNPPGSWYKGDASAVAIFDMTDDIVYTYRGSWCTNGLMTTWESNWFIVGEHGGVSWDGADRFEAVAVREVKGFMPERVPVEVPPFDAGDKVGGHSGLIRDFLRAMQTGVAPETVCTDNIKSLAMVFGAIEAAERRAWYSIP